MKRWYLYVAAGLVFFYFLKKSMSSKIDLLAPEIAKRWLNAQKKFAELYPDDPQPFLTDTHRPNEKQNELYAIGRTVPGKKVTNARGGESLHNYIPAHAFDIAFKTKQGQLDWDADLFERFAVIAKSLGLEWGGDWSGFKDRPHFQAPNYTWQMAAAGIQPTYAHYA